MNLFVFEEWGVKFPFSISSQVDGFYLFVKLWVIIGPQPATETVYLVEA